MSPPEHLPDHGGKLEGIARPEEFSSREVFNHTATEFIEILQQADAVFTTEEDGNARQIFVMQMHGWFSSMETVLHSAEISLFQSAYDLFCFKHDLGTHFPEKRTFVEEGGRAESITEVGGGMAIGKTVLTDYLAEVISADKVDELFTSDVNPFWGLAYSSDEYMTRSQWWFLAASVNESIRARYFPGRYVRDSTPYSDALIMMRWRHLMDKVTDDEYATYMELFDLLQPTIPEPNLLIIMQTSSVDRIHEGYQNRREADDTRAAEIATREDFKAIYQATEWAIEVLRDKYELNPMVLTIDPVELWKNPDLKYAHVYKIMGELGLLGELIQPPRQEVVNEILDYFAWHEGRLFYLYSPTMFTGKTTALIEVYKRSQGRMAIFRPIKSMRKDLGEDEDTLKSRAGLESSVISIDTNRLTDVLVYIRQQKISPQECPIVAFDEAMLFEDSPIEAIQALNDLRQMGFNVLVAGVALTFKGEPFGFMDAIGYLASQDPQAEATMATTKCAFCDHTAEVTQLEKDGELAHYDDPDVFIGDLEFTPVCGTRHASCESRPEPFTGFEDNLVPREKGYYQEILTEAGVEV